MSNALGTVFWYAEHLNNIDLSLPKLSCVGEAVVVLAVFFEGLLVVAEVTYFSECFFPIADL